MNISKHTKIASALVLAMSLAACGSDGDSTGSTTNNANNPSNPPTTTPNPNPTPPPTTSPTVSANILDNTQNQLGNIVNGLGNQLSVVDASSPLKVGAFVRCLNPAVNQLLDGPDALLSNLLSALNGGVSAGINNATQAFNPALIQEGVVRLAGGVQSLTTTLPQALMALAGQGTCTSTTAPGGDNPLDALTALATDPSNPLAPLFTALIDAGVPADGGGAGPTNTPLDVILAPLTQLAGGAGAPGDLTNLASVVNQVATGVNTLNSALFQSLLTQTAAVPVVGGVTELLGDALSDVALVLTDLDNATTTNQELLGTLNNLLVNVTDLFSAIPGNEVATAPIQSAIGALTSGLSTITSPLTQLLGMVAILPGTSATPGGDLPTSWIPVLGGLIDGATSNVTPPAPGSTPPAAPALPTDALNAIPVIGPILGGVLGGLFGGLGGGV